MIWKLPQETVAQWGNSSNELLLDEVQSILVWNVFKGQRGPQFAEDLHRLSKNKSFLMLQETMMHENTPPLWKKQVGDINWSVAQSFEYKTKNAATGVAIGSSAKPLTVDFIRPKSRELFWLTPKISLLTEFNFQGTRALFVCSHVLNFVTTSVFTKSLEEIAERVATFNGPILLAGDFNTWNLKRYLSMKSIFRNLQLEHVSFDVDERFLKLDHVFVRGFDVQSTKILHSVVSSDHFPIEVQLVLRK